MKPVTQRITKVLTNKGGYQKVILLGMKTKILFDDIIEIYENNNDNLKELENCQKEMNDYPSKWIIVNVIIHFNSKNILIW